MHHPNQSKAAKVATPYSDDQKRIMRQKLFGTSNPSQADIEAAKQAHDKFCAKTLEFIDRLPGTTP